jgi:hypothetical protein
VADLLECVIQIKGVADTPRRLVQRVEAWLAEVGASDGDAVARDVVWTLAVREAWVRESLHLMLSADRPQLSPLAAVPPASADDRAVGAGVERFTSQREAMIGVLDRCSADDLNRVGLEPSRGAMTVADLVALVLAFDTDQLGRLVVPGTRSH